MWEIFRKYHYLNTDLHTASQQYVGVLNGEIVCHTGVIYFPMRKGKKRVHRLVVLPDYQGVGIGTHFIKEVAKITTREGFELNLTTTTPALVGALKRDNEWVLARFDRAGNLSSFCSHSKDEYKTKTKHLGNATSCKRITYSFWYKPK